MTTIWCFLVIKCQLRNTLKHVCFEKLPRSWDFAEKLHALVEMINWGPRQGAKQFLLGRHDCLELPANQNRRSLSLKHHSSLPRKSIIKFLWLFIKGHFEEFAKPYGTKILHTSAILTDRKVGQNCSFWCRMALPSNS